MMVTLCTPIGRVELQKNRSFSTFRGAGENLGLNWLGGLQNTRKFELDSGLGQLCVGRAAKEANLRVYFTQLAQRDLLKATSSNNLHRVTCLETHATQMREARPSSLQIWAVRAVIACAKHKRAAVQFTAPGYPCLCFQATYPLLFQFYCRVLSTSAMLSGYPSAVVCCILFLGGGPGPGGGGRAAEKGRLIEQRPERKGGARITMFFNMHDHPTQRNEHRCFRQKRKEKNHTSDSSKGFVQSEGNPLRFLPLMW